MELSSIDCTPEELRAILEAQKKWEHDQASYRLAARQEGYAQGLAEARQRIAENLRNMGLSPEQIAQATSPNP